MIAPQVRSAGYWPHIVWRGFRRSGTSRRPRRTVQIRQSGRVAPGLRDWTVSDQVMASSLISSEEEEIS
jgi:hypothetical protein